jgi:membrane protein
MATAAQAPRRKGRALKGPTALPRRSWWNTVKRTVQEFQDDQLTDKAAALTYYGVLALFPAMIVLVALLGLLGEYPRTTNAVFEILSQAGASITFIDAVREPLTHVVNDKGGAGALFGFGLVLSLWSASGYLGAFIRSANEIYEINEGRPFWKLRPLQLLITLLIASLVVVLLLGIVLTGPLADAVSRQVGLGDTASKIWAFAKWPVMAGAAMLIIAVLYYLAPNVRQPRFRWISPGGAIAVALWGVVTVAFFFYVQNLGSYDKTYGSLGTVISLLVWMWLSNLALLFGLEFDAELERERELLAGVPEAERNIQLEPRQVPGNGPVRTDVCEEEVDERVTERLRTEGPQTSSR